MAEAIAFLGGLGLFLTAIRLLAALPTQVGAGRARDLLARTAGHPWRVALTGSLTGLALQSTSAVTLILGGFVGARLIEPVAAMGIIAWANVGSSALVFLASITVWPLALLLVGLAGIALYDARGSSRAIHIPIEAAPYAGIMLLGLAIMRNSAFAMKDTPLVMGLVGAASTSVSAAIMIGFVASLLMQSSSAALMITLAVVPSGLVSVGDGVVIALGASVASGASVLVLGAGCRGSERQLILFQAAAKTMGVVAVLPPLLVDRWHPSLGIGRAMQRLVGDPATEISAVFFLCQIASVSAFYAARSRIAALMAQLAPPLPLQENVSLPTICPMIDALKPPVTRLLQ